MALPRCRGSEKRKHAPSQPSPIEGEGVLDMTLPESVPSPLVGEGPMGPDGTFLVLPPP